MKKIYNFIINFIGSFLKRSLASDISIPGSLPSAHLSPLRIATSPNKQHNIDNNNNNTTQPSETPSVNKAQMIADSFPPPVCTMPEKFVSSKKKLSLLPESAEKRSNSNSNNKVLKIEN